MVLEGAMVALYRCFPEAHPIFKLMEPHFEGTAFINWAAQEVHVVHAIAWRLVLGGCIVVADECLER